MKVLKLFLGLIEAIILKSLTSVLNNAEYGDPQTKGNSYICGTPAQSGAFAPTLLDLTR